MVSLVALRNDRVHFVSAKNCTIRRWLLSLFLLLLNIISAFASERAFAENKIKEEEIETDKNDFYRNCFGAIMSRSSDQRARGASMLGLWTHSFKMLAHLHEWEIESHLLERKMYFYRRYEWNVKSYGLALWVPSVLTCVTATAFEIYGWKKAHTHTHKNILYVPHDVPIECRKKEIRSTPQTATIIVEWPIRN